LMLAVPLLHPLWNCIRSDIRLQIKRRKNQHVNPAVWNFVHWLPRYASTILYCCIMVLQLLYRWQHQSGILWISPRVWTVFIVLALSTHPTVFCDYFCDTLYTHARAYTHTHTHSGQKQS
jgi:hypothetical protein